MAEITTMPLSAAKGLGIALGLFRFRPIDSPFIGGLRLPAPQPNDYRSTVCWLRWVGSGGAGFVIQETRMLHAPKPLYQANQQAANQWVAGTPAQQRVPSILDQLGVDPVTKQAEAIKDLAAAIRELADVIYHIGTDDN